jgi:Spy/CpxP family protein refolding chaperone
MTRHNRVSSLTLASLLIAVGSVALLSSCNNQQTSETKTSEQPSAQTQPTTAAQSTQDTGDTPLTAVLPQSDRPASDPLQLLQTEPIKKELSLTAEQTTKLKQIDQEFRSDVSKIAEGVQWKELTPEQQEQKLKELTQKMDKETQETRQKVGQVLSPAQSTRAKQIFLQTYGWGVLTQNDFSSELKITTDQQKQLDELRDQLLQKMKTNWEVPDTNDPKQREQIIARNRKRLDQIIKESNEQALTVLTPEQKKNLETLKGKKFQLDPSQLQPASS